MAEPAEETLEGRHRRIIGLTSVGVLMVVMTTIVNVRFRSSEGSRLPRGVVFELQWVVNAYALSFAVLLLPPASSLTCSPTSAPLLMRS